MAYQQQKAVLANQWCHLIGGLDAANDEFNQAPGQESETYRSSVVNFMENISNDIGNNWCNIILYRIKRKT